MTDVVLDIASQPEFTEQFVQAKSDKVELSEELRKYVISRVLSSIKDKIQGPSIIICR